MVGATLRPRRRYIGHLTKPRVSAYYTRFWAYRCGGVIVHATRPRCHQSPGPPCKAKPQYVLTFQVSTCCCLALLGGAVPPPEKLPESDLSRGPARPATGQKAKPAALHWPQLGSWPFEGQIADIKYNGLADWSHGSSVVRGVAWDAGGRGGYSGNPNSQCGKSKVRCSTSDHDFIFLFFRFLETLFINISKNPENPQTNHLYT